MLLNRCIIVTELNQHQILWLQRMVNLIPTTFFKKSACAAATFGFVKHNCMLGLNQMTERGEVFTFHKGLKLLSPTCYRVTVGFIIRVKCVICRSRVGSNKNLGNGCWLSGGCTCAD